MDHEKMAIFHKRLVRYLSRRRTESDEIADSSTTLRGRQHGDIVSSHVARMNGLWDPKVAKHHVF